MFYAARLHAGLGLLLLGIATAATAAPASQATGTITGAVTTDAIVPVPLSGACSHRAQLERPRQKLAFQVTRPAPRL